MRMTSLFGRTLWEAPADADTISQALLMRTGMVRQVAPGLYAFLPLGWRVMQRICGVVREELEALGGQELWTPDAPAGPEGVFTLLAHREVQSYRKLPCFLYQIGTRLRHEPKSRGGLLRARPSLTLDACSFHADEDDLDAQYRRAREAYVNVLRRCDLDVRVVDGDAGPLGSTSHEFVLLNPEGDDQVVLCDSCGYAATLTAAVFDKGPGGSEEPELPLEEVATPDCTTIQAVANYLGVPTSQTAKAVFYSVDVPACPSPLDCHVPGQAVRRRPDGDRRARASAEAVHERTGKRAGTSLEGQLVFVVIRGDLEVNEARLARLLAPPQAGLGATRLRPATEEEIRAVGVEPGYASPVGLPSSVRVIVDDSIPPARNLVAGANRPGYHLRNVNYGRDFPGGVPPGLRTAHQVADIALVHQGDPCARCGEPLRLTTAISLGRAVKLGARPAEALGATFVDRDGWARPLAVGYYTIALDRLMAAIVAAHHDEHGIVWPPAVAPFDLYLLRLGEDQAVIEAAESLYESLNGKGFAVLYDDRKESAGVKFADADLIGVPWRVTVSRRSLAAGGVELKARWEASRRVVRPDELSGALTGPA